MAENQSGSRLVRGLEVDVCTAVRGLELEDAQLVATEKVGRSRQCTLGPRRLDDLQEWIETYRRMVDERLDRFGELLERTTNEGDAQ